EGFLRVVTLFGGQAGVVGQGIDAALAQFGGQFIHVAAAHAVDDARLVGMSFQHLADLLENLVARPDAVGQIGPVEVADEDNGFNEAELCRNVTPNLLGGGGGEGVDVRFRDEFAQPAHHAVFGAEVVSPVANAVRLVDGEVADAQLGQGAIKVGLNELFGR